MPNYADMLQLIGETYDKLREMYSNHLNRCEKCKKGEKCEDSTNMYEMSEYFDINQI